MRTLAANPDRIRAAWQGRVSGCMLGKPLEVLSFAEGKAGLEDYLRRGEALPLRDYVPYVDSWSQAYVERKCCRGEFARAEADDDINYTVLALLLLEDKGIEFSVADVARLWLRRLPAGETWTAERSAYKTLLNNMVDEFVHGDEPGFDIRTCSANVYNDWIGAQIRADLYGWVCPGQPELAAQLARRDASLSHRGEGVSAAAFVAALGAALAATDSLDDAIDAALQQIPEDSDVAEAARFAAQLGTDPRAVDKLHDRYAHLPPVHAVNNLALVVWALCSSGGDFSTGIGNAVEAGWDTDCNGATVGGLLGISGAEIPDHWTRPWNGRVGVSLAGHHELELEDVVNRTISVARSIRYEISDTTEALSA